MYERLWCVSVSKILFSNFWPVTTPCKGEAGTLAVAARSWYIKKIYILTFSPPPYAEIEIFHSWGFWAPPNFFKFKFDPRNEFSTLENPYIHVFLASLRLLYAI